LRRALPKKFPLGRRGVQLADAYGDLRPECRREAVQRPAVCRAYGFHVARDGGLYCRDILARVERGECEGVVWGSAATVEWSLDEIGGRLDLRELAERSDFW